MSIRTRDSIRMRDIAADLGVSVITVSKVLRNQGRISSEMRKREMCIRDRFSAANKVVVPLRL